MSRTQPHTTITTTRTAKGAFTPFEWAEVRDALVLALDALGDGPDDVSPDFLANCMMNQRVALQVTHRRAERLGLAFVSKGQKNLTPAQGGHVHA